MNKRILAFSLIFSLSLFVFAADDVAMSAFVDGCRAYSKGDWVTAILSLKKAASFDSNNNPETYFMLINAEINAEDYKSALDDCEWYLETFKRSLYFSNVMYLKGRCLYLLGEYDKAVIILSDFCHQYENHDMYASALFWIGECFYACYQYDDAFSIYQRIVSDFSDDSKASVAQYRIETIGQRDREEKLLYLLKQTGEEYLIAKEEYEKQLKIKNPEGTASSRQKLYDANERNRELENKYEELAKQLEELKAKTNGDADSTAEENNLIRELKQKAAQTKMLLDYMNDEKDSGEN